MIVLLFRIKEVKVTSKTSVISKAIVLLIIIILVFISFAYALSEDDKLALKSMLLQIKDNEEFFREYLAHLNESGIISDQPDMISYVGNLAYSVGINIDEEYPNIRLGINREDKTKDSISTAENPELSDLTPHGPEETTELPMPSDFDASQMPPDVPDSELVPEDAEPQKSGSLYFKIMLIIIPVLILIIAYFLWSKKRKIKIKMLDNEIETIKNQEVETDEKNN